MSRRCNLTPYHSDLDTLLLRLGRDHLYLRDLFEGIAIFGAPGSGKTSASLYTLLVIMLLSGFGGIFCCAKADAADEIRRAAKAAGRLNDLIFVDGTENSALFNILDFVMRYLGGDGFLQNVVELVSRMVEATRQASGTGGGDSENRYFTDGALKWVFHAAPLLEAAYGTLRLADLNAFIASIPQTVAEARSEEWKASFCYRTLARVAVKAKQAAASGHPDPKLDRIIREHGDFFLEEVAKLDARPKTSITSTLTNMLYPFLAGKLADLFCTETTVTPFDARSGKIIVLNLPTLIYGAGGVVVQVLFKYLFGVAMQSAKVKKDTRPVFVVADEAQYFVNSSDADLLATARSAKISVIYATQDMPTYYAKLGANSRAVTDSLLGKFGTKIFHANLSRETNIAAADLIGKVEKFHVSETRSQGNASGGGGSQHDHSGGFHGNQGANTSTGQSTSGYMDYEVPPEHFATKLRTGSKANAYKVDAILVRTARTWKSTGRHWLQAEFSQR